jgi:hypothetical protein
MGVIKNYDYDTAFIGSSMIQNFDMRYFRKNYSAKPVKLVVGGMTLNEILKMYSLSQEYSNASKYIINVDLIKFNMPDPLDMSSSKFPGYLYNNNRIDDIKYLLSYEVWFRYLPIDTLIDIMYKSKLKLPQKFDDSTNLDRIEDWSKDYTYGEEIVKDNYLNVEFSTSAVETKDMSARIKKNIDTYLELITKQKKKGQTIIFGLPPYSSLYWHTTIDDGTYEIWMQAKEYFIKECFQYSGIRIVDMQSIPEITDLNYYRDATHYNTDIQTIYADGIISGKYDIKNINDIK